MASTTNQLGQVDRYLNTSRSGYLANRGGQQLPILKGQKKWVGKKNWEQNMNLRHVINQKDLYIARLERENVQLKRKHPEEVRQKDNI